MRALVACEYSGTIRDALSANGWDAWSCDLILTESDLTKQEEKHYQGDVRDIIDDVWDLLIAHPYCTYNANSGVRWLKESAERWYKLFEGIEFFKLFLNSKIKYKAIEQPIIHKYAQQLIGIKYDQVIQPWQFGHPESKATCLWLHNLPKLKPTDILCKPINGCWENQSSTGQNKVLHEGKWISFNNPLTSHIRSKTYPGIAKAMAEQWTKYIINLQ